MLEQAFLCTVFPSKSRLITGQLLRANTLSAAENPAGNGSHGNALTNVFSGYVPARPHLTFPVARGVFRECFSILLAFYLQAYILA